MTLTQNSTLKEFRWQTTDGTMIYLGRIINYGRFEVIERDVAFKIDTDGDSLFDCEEKEIAEKLANILYVEASLPRPTDDNIGIWRGRYIPNREFVVDDKHVDHLLFLSNRNLRPIANIICSDYIICKGFDALVISRARFRSLLKSHPCV